VRQSNVDSFEYKDLAAPARWEHGVASAYLATRCLSCLALPESTATELILAALLHDTGTPPFAHTIEGILPGFDHEQETANLLSGQTSAFVDPEYPVFAGEAAQFLKECERLRKDYRIKVDADNVAQLILGHGPYGHLVAGPLDLDNADNVVRSATYLGIEVNRTLPLRLADWLATQQSVCVELESVPDPHVQSWRDCRYQLYQALYASSIEELARQALLNYLIRAALRSGFEKRNLVWNTDYGLIHALSQLDTPNPSPQTLRISELVKRYQLLQHPHLIVEVSIDQDPAAKQLSTPLAGEFLNNAFSTNLFQTFILIVRKRYDPVLELTRQLPGPPGRALLFSYDPDVRRYGRLPDWLQANLPQRDPAALVPITELSHILRDKLTEWARTTPWVGHSPHQLSRVVDSLNSVSDWSFRLTRNEPFHTFPSTFVRSIPATLITLLQAQEGIILDPFGGTGTTAVEAALHGARAITADASSVAHLIATAKLTHLDRTVRTQLREAILPHIGSTHTDQHPRIDRADLWFHAATLRELSGIWVDVQTFAAELPAARWILLVAFSAILTSCTERRGREHGYFADNAPLPKGMPHPSYIDAGEEYRRRLLSCLGWIERRYSEMERRGREPRNSLSRISSLQVPIQEASLSAYDIGPHSVDAIITSPPYVGMADYTLAQRLTYDWIFPGRLEADFAQEIGSRRGRFSPEDTVAAYELALRAFAALAHAALTPTGHVAIVLGQSTGKSFADLDSEKMVIRSFEDLDMPLLWSSTRPISWNRNYGVHRLTHENILVFANGGPR
jgi:hypothetical protein